MKTSTVLSCSGCGKEISMFQEFDEVNGKFYHSPGCLKTMDKKEEPRVITMDIKEQPRAAKVDSAKD